jgi:hypothetical protein
MIRKLWNRVLQWGLHYDQDGLTLAKSGDYAVTSGSKLQSDASMRMHVFFAEGGTVVEIRINDNSNTNSNRPTMERFKTVVIPDSEDLAYRVGQIVAMESLRA